MTDYRKPRQVPRISLPGQPAARTRSTETVRLLDLSLKGVRIEHLSLLRPGGPCTVEFPAAFGSLVLPAQVVWSRVIGTDASPEGERILRYQSGLTFPQVTAEQQTILAQALEKATSSDAQKNGGLTL
jgi:hypothetical protein